MPAPTAFEAIALAWIGVSVVIIGAVITAIIQLAPRWEAMKSAIERHDKIIAGNAVAITDLRRSVAEQQPIVDLVKEKVIVPLPEAEPKPQDTKPLEGA